MTLIEARKILKLGPEEDPRPHLAEFRRARERIAEWVRTAPNEILADRYQEGLIEFDQAFAAILEFLEAQEWPPLFPPPIPVVEAPVPRRRCYTLLVCLFVMLVGASACAWFYFRSERTKELERDARITMLDRQGTALVENRRWQEAARSFAEIEALAPGSELARLGRRNIDDGIAEEQTQFVAYWTGQAIAELESGRVDEAQTAIQKVLEKLPAEKQALAIFDRITAARAGQARDAALAAARKQFDAKQWNEVILACRAILATTPDHADAQALLADASAALAKYTADQLKAKSLLDRAIASDHGQFDAEVLDWLREAGTLAPDNKEIAARLEKMASYTRTLRVPGDYATPEEALAVARDRDRIVLSEQTWRGTLFVNAAIELQGAGSAKTIVECPATDGSPITIGPGVKGARISGITFRHEAFHAAGSERFSAALVRGGSATFIECRFSGASGHGLMVIDHGSAIANRCRFSDNAWNGAAATGGGSLLEVRDSESVSNYEHGLESWDGAAVTLVNNRCEANCRNGIHADSGSFAATITGNQLLANREFGLVLDSAGAGEISGNTARANLLGGLVIRMTAAKLPVTGNLATLNLGPGLVLEAGLRPAVYATNTMSKNMPPEVITDARLSERNEVKAAPPNKNADPAGVSGVLK